MFQNLGLGMLIVLFSACGKNDVPEGVLTEKQMVETITELYLVEEQVNRLSIPYDSMKKLFPKFSQKAFEKAGVSDTTFNRSMDYYMANPEKLGRIYTVLIDSLNLKAQRMNAQKEDVAPE